MKGIKGFQKGHIVSEETRLKISQANDGNFYAKCDYCGKEYHTRRSAYLKRKRHFCSRKCYSMYRSEFLPKEEQFAYGKGLPEKERALRIKARSILNHYLRDNNIQRQPCEICGKLNTEAHHDDYSQPLSIRWLCFKHHREWHKAHGNKELLKTHDKEGGT